MVLSGFGLAHDLVKWVALDVSTVSTVGGVLVWGAVSRCNCMCLTILASVRISSLTVHDLVSTVTWLLLVSSTVSGCSISSLFCGNWGGSVMGFASGAGSDGLAGDALSFIYPSVSNSFISELLITIVAFVLSFLFTSSPVSMSTVSTDLSAVSTDIGFT